MSGWIIVQIILNICFIAAALVCWARLNRPQKDDPRLSRGLQLLQSKIAILEDLSDRTDIQVKQLAALLEQKGKYVQECITEAQIQMQKVEQAIEKTLDVSKIFQERVPHKEIVERQNTRKYVQAAKMAHQGMSVDEIAEKIDIPRSELEFIVKVNKNKLMFSEDHLPEWANDEKTEEEVSARPRDFSSVFEAPKVSQETEEDDKRIQEEFKKAIEEAKAKDIARENSMSTVMAESVAETVSEGLQTAKTKISGLADRFLKPHFIEGDEQAQEVDEANKINEIKEDNAEPLMPALQELSESKDAIKEAAELAARAKKKRSIIKDDEQTTRALKPFVFKKLKEENII